MGKDEGFFGDKLEGQGILTDEQESQGIFMDMDLRGHKVTLKFKTPKIEV